MIPERAEIKIEDVKTTIKELDKIRKEGKINNLNQIKEKLIELKKKFYFLYTGIRYLPLYY